MRFWKTKYLISLFLYKLLICFKSIKVSRNKFTYKDTYMYREKWRNCAQLRGMYCCGVVFEIRSDLTMQIEIINILLSHIYASSYWTIFYLVILCLTKKKKKQKWKIFCASGNCAQNKNCKQWMFHRILMRKWENIFIKPIFYWKLISNLKEFGKI